MSEARRCDRCHGYFELPAEDQKNRDYPYYIKGTYVKIMLFGRYGEHEDSTRWYDLCPNCMELLDKWLENPDCADRSNGTTDREYELALKLNEAKIYIAQLKNELGYTMTKEEIAFMRGIHNFTDEDISEAAKFVETKSSEAEYKDPCKSCHDGVCEQCCYGYCSEEEKKNRWLGNHKEVKLSDPYEDGGL